MTITVNIDDPPYNAVGNGVTDDSAAFLLFQSNFQGEVDDVVLVLRNGGDYNNASASAFFQGIPNLTINMEGATIRQWATPGAFYQVANTSALLSSALQGSFTITLVTSSETSFFTVGRVVCVAALDMQGSSGYPPNWFYFSFHRIASIGVGSITLETALPQTYKTTFPQTSSGAYNTGGPATVFTIKPEWDQILTVNGGTARGSLDCSFAQVQVSAREFYINDIDFIGSGVATLQIDPTIAEIGVFTRCSPTVSGAEVDKELSNFTMIDCDFSGYTVHHQSASVAQANIVGGSFGTILNVPKQMSISGGAVIDTLRLGNGGFGANLFLSIADSTVSAIELSPNTNWMDLTGSLSNYAEYIGSGVFKVDNESTAYGFAIPGAIGFFRGTGGGGPLYWGHIFRILDVWSSGGFLYFSTTLTLPALPLYSGVGGLSLTELVLHPGQSVTFSNVIGCSDVEALSLALPGAPAFSYFEREYAGSVGSVGVTPLTDVFLVAVGQKVLGKLVYIKVNVTKAFTGIGNPFMRLGQSGMQVWSENNVWIRNDQFVDLRQVGLRTLGPGSVIGAAGSDSLFGFSPGDQAPGDINAYIDLDFSGQSESLWPEFTIIIQTDQEIEIPVLTGQTGGIFAVSNRSGMVLGGGRR